MAALLLAVRDLGLPAVVSAAVILFGSLVSRGALHRTDRVGGAAVAIGFAVGYQAVVGGGFDPTELVSLLPLVAVASALLVPRIAARFAPGAGVGASVRAGLVVAGLAGAAALSVADQPHLAGLTLAAIGAGLGALIGAQVGDREPLPLLAPDARAGTWTVVAGLLAAVWGFAIPAGVSAVAVALLVAALVAPPIAAKRGGAVGSVLALVLPAGLGAAAALVAQAA